MKKLITLALVALLIVGCTPKSDKGDTVDEGNKVVETETTQTEVGEVETESVEDSNEVDEENKNETSSTPKEEDKTASTKPAETKPTTSTKPTESKPVETKPAETKPATKPSTGGTTKPSTGGSTTKPNTGSTSKPSTGGNTTTPAKPNTSVKTFTEVIPAGWEYVNDNTMPLNEEKVVKAKVDGSKTVTVTITNGVESRKEVITKQPVNGVMHVGTKIVGKTTVERGLAEQTFKLINDYRSSKGLNKLTWSESAYGATVIRAKELALAFSHTRPNGQNWNTAASHIGQFGENLTAGSHTAAEAVQNWKDSPAHNELLLSTVATHGAVGFVYVDGTPMQAFWALN